ncbi:MAG TPA: hypothetical protein VL624_05290, partial [Caldimonas sp.]|nr:hypothetical protein [Caldimonas sp.]
PYVPLQGPLAAADRVVENRPAAQETATKGRGMVKIRMLAAALAATLLPSLALAQASAPIGVERPTTGAPGKGTTTTREARRAETVEARKKGELTPAGGGTAPVSKSAKSHSTMTKEKRKAETMEARKKGELVPAGGGGPAPSK